MLYLLFACLLLIPSTNLIKAGLHQESISDYFGDTSLIQKQLQDNDFGAFFTFLNTLDREKQIKLATTPLSQIVPENQHLECLAPSRTAVHWAAHHNNVKALKYLYDLGVNLDIADDFITPLLLAIKGDAVEAIEYLQSTGISIVTPGDDGATPLHYAARFGKVAAIECLHKLGANLEAEDLDRETPLFYAVTIGHVSATQCLVRLGAKIDAKNHGNSSLMHAAASLKPDFSNSSVELIKLLNGLGLSLDAVDAADVHGTTPLQRAAAKGFVENIDCLCQLGASTEARNLQGETALHSAALSDRSVVITALCRLKANLEAQDNFGYTPLHRAVTTFSSSLKTIKCLCNLGAKINALTTEDETPFEVALKMNNSNTVAFLFTRGARIAPLNNELKKEKYAHPKNVADMQTAQSYQLILDIEKKKKQGLDDTATWLMKAVSLELTALVEYLLPGVRNVNAQWEDGNTVLHIAAAKGNASLIRLLATHYALDFFKPNNKHELPLDCMNRESLYKINSVYCEIERALKIRLFIWLMKSDIRNEQGRKIVFPADLCRFIACKFTL